MARRLPCGNGSCSDQMIGLLPFFPPTMPVRFATPYVQHWTSAESGSARVTSPVNCLAFSPSTRYLASGHESGELVVWETDSGRKLKIWAAEKAVTSITWHTGWNSLVIWGCLGGNAYMWNFWVSDNYFRSIIVVV